jgi:hypothetical protein
MPRQMGIRSGPRELPPAPEAPLAEAARPAWERRPWARRGGEQTESEIRLADRLKFRLREAPPFAGAQAPPPDRAAVLRQAEIEARLANPFPVRRICAMRTENSAISLQCELPDEPELCWLPYALVALVNPALVVRFLEDAADGPDAP